MLDQRWFPIWIFVFLVGCLVFGSPVSATSYGPYDQGSVSKGAIIYPQNTESMVEWGFGWTQNGVRTGDAGASAASFDTSVCDVGTTVEQYGTDYGDPSNTWTYIWTITAATPTPTSTPISATWDCSDDYTSVICNGGSRVTNLDTSIVYTSHNQIDTNCWDFGKLPEGDYSTSGGIVTVGTCQFEVPVSNSTCITRSGYTFMSNTYWANQAALITATFGETAALPFLWAASVFNPCPGGSSSVNATPTIPEPTWVPGPYIPPTYVFPTPAGGQGGFGIVGIPTPVGTVSAGSNIFSSTGLTTVPTNISIPLLPVTLPDMPDQLNSTTYIAYINSTPLIGPMIATPLNWIHSLMASVNNFIVFLLNFIVSPLSSLTSTFVSVTANIDSILTAWQAGASLITALIWYSFMAVPAKVLNVLTLGLFFDIVIQVFDWPEDLS